ncbi:hypothetical protein Tco_1562075 [Tanacetum coccineum]
MTNTCRTSLSSQAVNRVPTHYPCDSARTFRVMLFSIHNDEWKSFQCHHQTALRLHAHGLTRDISGKRGHQTGPRKRMGNSASIDVLEKVGSVAYKLELPQEFSRVHNTFHVSNMKKCYFDEPLAVPLEGLH